MKRNSFIILLVCTVAVLGFTLAAAAQNKQAQKKVQTVKLTYDKDYVFTPSTLTLNVPVKVEVDLATVKGCGRTVVIAAFDVKKTVKEGDNTIEFTPTKTGKIAVDCGMNMIHGSFMVVAPTTH